MTRTRTTAGALTSKAGVGKKIGRSRTVGRLLHLTLPAPSGSRFACGDGSCCRRSWSWPTTWSDGSPFGDEYKTEENFWLATHHDWECEDNIKEADCLGYCDDNEIWEHGKDGCESKWDEDNHNCERYSPMSNASTVDGWRPCNDCSCPARFEVVAKIKVIAGDDPAEIPCGFEETSYEGDNISAYPFATMTAESKARYLNDGGINGKYNYETEAQRWTCGGRENPDGSDMVGDTWKYTFTCDSQQPKSSSNPPRWRGALETCQRDGSLSHFQAQNPDETSSLCWKPPKWEFEIPVTKTDCPCCHCGYCLWQRASAPGRLDWVIISSDCSTGCDCGVAPISGPDGFVDEAGNPIPVNSYVDEDGVSTYDATKPCLLDDGECSGECAWLHDAEGGGWTLTSSDCSDGCECDDPPENTDPANHAHAVAHMVIKPCIGGGTGDAPDPDGGEDDDDTGEAPDPDGGDDDADTGGAPDPGEDSGGSGGDDDTGDGPGSGGGDGGGEGDDGEAGGGYP